MDTPKELRLSKLEKAFWIAWHSYGFGQDHLPEMQHNIDGLKFDFCWPAERIAVEIDGNGRGHTSVQARHADTTKRNAATLLGWRVLVFTTKHFGSKQSREEMIHHILFLIGEAQEVGGEA